MDTWAVTEPWPPRGEGRRSGGVGEKVQRRRKWPLWNIPLQFTEHFLRPTALWQEGPLVALSYLRSLEFCRRQSSPGGEGETRKSGICVSSLVLWKPHREDGPSACITFVRSYDLHLKESKRKHVGRCFLGSFINVYMS